MKPFTFRALVLGLLLGALFGPVQAGLFDDDEARKAILELRERHAKTAEDSEKRYAELSRRIDRLDQLTDRLEKASRAQLELNNDISALRQEIARLRGQIEVQANETARFLAPARPGKSRSPSADIGSMTPSNQAHS